jgi:cytochrome c peroxidase
LAGIRIAKQSSNWKHKHDHRTQNQLSNPKGAFPTNHTQVMADFPFRMFLDPADNRSTILRDSGQRAGSAGVFRRSLIGIIGGASAEDGADMTDASAFRIGGLNVRQVTERNTPSVINSVFYVRNLWDGRASDIFTGATPFGASDTRAHAIAVSGGQLTAENVWIENSSLASQAVGPPMNRVEMSYQGRTWPKLGKKMLALRPLAIQQIAPDDSVLAPYAEPAGRGFLARHTYFSLVQAAFQPAYWDSDQHVDGEFTIAEYNFPLFFGLAVQAYESTLVSDQARFDEFSEGNTEALSAQEQSGLRIFRGRGECADCHLGPEFTSASFTSLARRGAIQRLRNGLLTDTGFVHTGVRLSDDDAGLHDKDDFGVPFALAAKENPAGPLGIAGAFKTPGLRNVEFTGPYFHNGGQASLEQVVEFYNRGGDFPDSFGLSPDVRRLNLSAEERAAVVEFMKSLSDDRVRFERAPFDHPEICVPTGYADPQAADLSFPLSAVDRWASIPAVGRKGNGVPLQTFEELLQGIGANGARAHALTDVCTIP